MQFLPKYQDQTDKALGDGIKLASWHLQTFGVLPELQGKGIGTALMDAVKEKVALYCCCPACATVNASQARKDKKELVLETATEANVRFHLRLRDSFSVDTRH